MPSAHAHHGVTAACAIALAPAGILHCGSSAATPDAAELDGGVSDDGGVDARSPPEAGPVDAAPPPPDDAAPEVHAPATYDAGT